MKKSVKRVFVFLAVAAAMIIGMVIFFRYGWKLIGFSICDSPDSIFAEKIVVEEDEVNISLVEANSISSYAGYIYKIEDGNLYIGINHKTLFSVFSGKVDYKIRIRTASQNVRKIYFKDKKHVWLIWSSDKGMLKHSEIKAQVY